jgi:hypothetical protein
MPDRAAAPAYLTLPKFSADIQLVISAVSGDDFVLEMLAMLSNCIDLSQSSGKLSDIMTPPDTIDKLLCSRVSGWIYRGYDYSAMEKVFHPELAIYCPESAKQEFSDSFYPDDPLIFINMLGDQNWECDASYLRTLPEVQAKAILTLLDESPVYIMTPKEMLGQVSCQYWGGFPDENDRVEELRDEQDPETLEDDIHECIGIVRDDFDVAYPAWVLSKKQKYSGALPEVAEKLKAANRKYQIAERKHKLSREYVPGTLPGVRLIGIEQESLQAQGIFNKLWDDTIEDAYNCTGMTYLCPFIAPFKIGCYDKAVAVLEVLRAYLDCMNTAAELLLWLQANAPKELKVTA